LNRQNHSFESNDGSFHYIDWGGDGPITHIAHATGLCSAAYTAIANMLRPHLNIKGLDFRGHGRTKAPANPRHLKNWSLFYHDLECFIETFKQPIIGIGHSLGGTVSLQVAAHRPELFKALILIEPGIMPPAWRPWVFLAQKTGLSKYVPFVTQASKRKNTWPDEMSFFRDISGKGQFKNWKNGFFEDFMIDGIQKTEQGAIRLSCNPAWEGRCLAMAPYDIWRYVGMIKLPTLVLYGRRSTTFLESVVKKFNKLVPHAVIEGFENTGHFVPMEIPDKTAGRILSFLRSSQII